MPDFDDPVIAAFIRQFREQLGDDDWEDVLHEHGLPVELFGHDVEAQTRGAAFGHSAAPGGITAASGEVHAVASDALSATSSFDPRDPQALSAEEAKALGASLTEVIAQAAAEIDIAADSPLGELMELALPPTQLRLVGAKDSADRNHVEPTFEQQREALQSWLLLFEMLADGGLPLTSAGYWRPVVVRRVVDELGIWTHGSSRREMDIPDVRRLRESMRGLGYARSYRGEFVLTKRGKAVASQIADGDLTQLWSDVAATLIPTKVSPGERCACIVTALLVAAGCPEKELVENTVLLLGEMGWLSANRTPLARSDIHWFTHEPISTLRCLDQQWRYRGRPDFSTTAQALAYEAMFGAASGG